MRIAVIGNGIIGYAASKYLSSKGYEVDCISPNIEIKSKIVKSEKKKLKSRAEKEKSLLISPKFNREDINKCVKISERLFPKETIDFFGLEMACEMGLARYWGANLACYSLSKDIKKLRLRNDELEFIKNLIPQLDVQEFYKKNYKFDSDINLVNNHLKNLRNMEYELHSSKLAIWEEKCDLKNLPGFDFSPAIFGSESLNDFSYRRINAKVERIQFESEDSKQLINLYIKENKRIYKEQYNYVFIACGAIGSYRLIRKSLYNNNTLMFDRIKHHPILSTISFLPFAPYPQNHIGTANLNLNLKLNKNKVYLNFIPLESSLKSIFHNKFKSKKYFFVKKFLESIILFSKKLSFIPFSPYWFLKRLYVTNINLSSDFSASYINFKDGKVVLLGGLRSDFEKQVFRNIWPLLVKSLRKRKIFNILIRPFIIFTGADLHYAGTLSNYTDENGRLTHLCKNRDNIIILDSSSSSTLPIPNPTFYFVLRAIKLMRSF